MRYHLNSDGTKTPIAGRGKAEYGASTVRKGTETGIDLAANASTNVYVTFDTPMPDNDYVVELYQIAYFSEFVVANKTNTGFRIVVKNTTGNAYTNQAITWTAFKLYTDNEYNNLLDSQKINDASVKETLTPIVPTLEVGTSYDNRTYYYKKGTRVYISFGINGLTPASTDTPVTLFRLPEGFRPRSNVILEACGYSISKKSVIFIYASGYVQCRLTEDGGCFGQIEFDAFN